METLIMSNDLVGIENLLDQSPRLIDKALRFACEYAQSEVVKMILQHYHVDTRKGFLYPSVLGGDLGIVELLVEYGADVNDNDDEELSTTTPLATACQHGYIDIIKYLVGKGAKVHYNCLFSSVTNYSCGAEFYDSSAVELLCSVFKKQIAPSMALVRYLHAIDRMLVIACSIGRLEVVRTLVANGGVPTCEFNYPVRVAAENGHLEVVIYLCNAGADIHVKNDRGVYWAYLHNHFEIVKYLMEKGAIINFMTSIRFQKYIIFCEKMKDKIRERSQKKIYFWWIPICYSLTHHSGCGKRMMIKNWEKTQLGILC
jgi:ankyrin repeat protein